MGARNTVAAAMAQGSLLVAFKTQKTVKNKGRKDETLFLGDQAFCFVNSHTQPKPLPGAFQAPPAQPWAPVAWPTRSRAMFRSREGVFGPPISHLVRLNNAVGDVGGG